MAERVYGFNGVAPGIEKKGRQRYTMMAICAAAPDETRVRCLQDQLWCTAR